MTGTHHKIKAQLYPNLLKNANGTYKARTITGKSRDIKDICNSLCSKPGIGIEPGNLEYHVKLFFEEMSDLLANGMAINTGYFAAEPTVRGAFKNKMDQFDSERHRVTFKFSQASILRKRAAGTQAEILHIIPDNYGIQQVTDNCTRSENNLITPGNVLHIKGIKLKLIGNQPDVGLYFINQTTGERIKVPPVDVITNQNARLLIMIPELPAGLYQLEHITQYGGKGIPLAQPRSSIFASILRIEQR